MTLKELGNNIKTFFAKIGSFIFVKTKLYIFDILILVAVIVVAILFFNHYDTPVTTMQSAKLLELTFSGKFFDFYSYINHSWFDYSKVGYDYSIIAKIPMNDQWQYCPAVYPIITYILYACINLPFYLFGLLFDIQIDAIFYVTLAKIAAAGALFVTYLFIKRIVELFFEKTDRKNILFTLFSSAILIFSAFVFNQLDSFYTCLLIMGLYFVLKHDFWKGFLLMGVGCAFKYLPLMICFPLILLYPKKPWPIIKYTLIMAIPSLFSVLLFLNNQGYQMTSIITEFNTQLFESKIDFGSSSVYLLFIFELIGLVFAYLYKIKENDKGMATIYFTCYFSCVFAIFLKWNPQWMLLIVPFYTLVLLLSKRKFLSFVSIFLVEIGYILFILTRFTLNIGNFMIELGLVSQIYSREFYYTNSFSTTLSMMFGNHLNFGAISFTILSIGAIALLVINFKQFIKNFDLTDESYKSPRYVHYLRLGIIFIYMIPSFQYFFNRPTANITSESYKTQFHVTYEIKTVSCDNDRITITGYAYDTFRIPYKNHNQVMLVDENSGTQYLLDTKQTPNGYSSEAKYYTTGFIVEMSRFSVPSEKYLVCLLVTNNGATSFVDTGVVIYDYYG